MKTILMLVALACACVFFTVPTTAAGFACFVLGGMAALAAADRHVMGGDFDV